MELYLGAEKLFFAPDVSLQKHLIRDVRYSFKTNI